MKLMDVTRSCMQGRVHQKRVVLHIALILEVAVEYDEQDILLEAALSLKLAFDCYTIFVMLVASILLS